MISPNRLLACFLVTSLSIYAPLECCCFSVVSTTTTIRPSRRNNDAYSSDKNAARHSSICRPRRSTTALAFFDKVFEESGPLGKGITVGKVQVAMQVRDRSKDSMFGVLERAAADSSPGTQEDLADLAHTVCLALLRKSDEWTAACSDSQWFSQSDAARAESLFNDWANREAAKFEKEYIPQADSEEKGGGATLIVVSLVIEIEGDSTKFDGAGFSLSGTKDVLSSIASDVLVQEGDCVNAVELFWTPGDRDEVLTRRDIIVDFPELIDL